MADPQLLGDVLAAEPLLLTPEEAATVLRVGRTTIYALMKAGELHRVHIGRSCRISRAELERYVRRLDGPSPSALSRPRRQRRTSTNQHGLFEFTSDPVERA
jgi:excisionase family DNA binding protein